MIELLATRPTSSTFAVAMGAAMLTSQLQYPPRVEAYEIQQVRGTYSDFMDTRARPLSLDHFTQQMAMIYNSFTQRQEHLGAEFDAAIFSDLEGLYEA